MFELIIPVFIIGAVLSGGWELYKRHRDKQRIYKERAECSIADFSWHPGPSFGSSDHWKWQLRGWKWLTNVPQGGSGGRAKRDFLNELQRKYGWENVKSGNAADPATGIAGPAPVTYAPGQIGIYVLEHPIRWIFWGPIARWLFRERG